MRLLSRRARSDRYSLFYVADIHGSEKCFRKFVNAGPFYGVNAVVLGGDITGKAFVPLVLRDDGTYEAQFLGRTEYARTEDELVSIEGQIRFNGFYPFRTSASELEDMATHPDRKEARFEAIISDAVRAWVSLADERLEGSGITCLVMPGNDDGEFVGDLLAEGRVLVNPEGRPMELGPFQVLSYGWSNITPWHSPRELAEDELEARITALAADLDPGRPTIYNLHVPPFGTRIDDAPEIRSNLSLVGGSSATMVPVGSTAVRRVIERDAPLLGLHGHIHESRGTARLGPTTCLNPGSDYNTGVLKGVIVRFVGSQIDDVQFVAA
jgi:Icc-related predicted phosphoesterase